MTCTTCNGWGIVYYIKSPPPSTEKARTIERKQGPTKLMLRETPCMSCGGYGTRPSRSDR